MPLSFLAPLSAAAIFSSAVLIFWMEPLFAKMILPRMGGSAAVWITALMFYQAVLLLGYVYAHLSGRLLSGRAQVAVHGALLGLAALMLPAAVPDTNIFAAPPTLHMLAVLGMGIGLPLLALSATAPLVQHWFSQSAHRDAGDPYFLYAASNVGSLGALLAFPFVIEPQFGMAAQNVAWSVLFGVVTLLILGSGIAVLGRHRRAPTPTPTPCPDQRQALSPEGREAVCSEGREAPARWKWLVLAAVPSSLLSGTTTIICTDIAPGPLMWMIPLGLYLLTFILAFGRREILPMRLLLLVQAALLVPVIVLAMGLQRMVGEYLMAALLMVLLFVSATVCHRRLFRMRPDSTRLTEFYLTIALGGLLGGTFNAVLSPLLFTGITEFPLVLVLALFLRPPPAQPARWPALVLPAAAMGGAAIAFALLAPLPPTEIRTILAFVLVMATIVLAAQPVRAGLMMAIALLAVELTAPSTQLHAARNFYGVVRVTGDLGSGTHRLVSGTTVHGLQSQDPALRREPTLYYHRAGPLGDVFAAMGDRVAGDAVTVVGLGAGTVACYAPADARWTFIDINPEVVRLATDARYFTFLHDCQPHAALVVADGRMALAGTANGQALIVLDAFSSDSVPIHLMTREAMALYAAHLAADGVIAVHITNRFLDLAPQLASLAASMGVPAMVRTAVVPGELGARSRWAVLSRDPQVIATLKQAGWQDLPASAAAPWTDDHSNLLEAILAHWKG